MSTQPEINIGLVGHVDHGKTTLAERLSGKWTDTHSEEIKRGITIRLGYADVQLYERKDKTLTTKAKEDGKEHKPLRKISLVDAPGHESLMATMLAGTTIMDGAILLISANEQCPQPQTKEHLMALEISGIENVIVVQNKVDLVNKERATRNYEQIKEFLKGSKYEDAPIIPLSAARGVNIDLLLQTIQELIPTPKRDKNEAPMMLVARSFDTNKPGTTPDKLQGGVVGGAIVQGTIRVGDRIELRPGRIYEEANQIKAQALFATVSSAITGGKPAKEVHPGGSMALMTDIDPAVIKSDSLTGNVVGLPDKLPPVWSSLTLETHLLERVVGAAEELKVNPIVPNELLMLNVNSAATIGIVRDLGKNQVSCQLKKPVCAAVGARVTISRRVGNRFRLIGYGIIKE
ncbi:MAG: translation initiation factor IF-2 subunit gamma [Candidatus Woesearchaeota archaeon]|nr:translation initiation factor IF-2 subunit gamma [Candidatus Woesearchaeota archaeon]